VRVPNVPHLVRLSPSRSSRAGTQPPATLKLQINCIQQLFQRQQLFPGQGYAFAHLLTIR
jgi:hypothetical protein